MDTPLKVTVYIPPHNYEQFVAQAIQSVLSQSAKDWELIVVDDGSTDGTRDILSKYSGHQKIRVVEQEKRGLNVTNNIAMRLARGKYLIRLYADDFMDENLLLADSKNESNYTIPIVE